MIKIVSVAEMKRIEQTADANGISYAEMMERAGLAIASRILEAVSRIPGNDPARVTILVGPGNNGGDGLVAARIVAQNSDAQVRCYLLSKREDTDPYLKAVSDAGVFIANAEDDQRFRVLTNMVASSHILVDALFGIGVRLPLTDNAEKLLRHASTAISENEVHEMTLSIPSSPDRLNPPTRPYIIAVDCPSGLNSDTGELDRHALYADETITIIAAKPGLFLFPGAEAVGKLTVAPIGIPQDTEGLKEVTHFVVDGEYVRSTLPPRPNNAHKGTFGKALIAGGSVNYTGAPGLAAEAAYRAGAGLVSVAAPGPVVTALAAYMLEATWLLLPHDMGVIAASGAEMLREEAPKYAALLLGPGLGREKTTGEMIQRLLQQASAAPAKQRAFGFGAARNQDQPQVGTSEEPLPPLVIDADGLYLLSRTEKWWESLPPRTVLTPHPGEMAQMMDATTENVNNRRWEIVQERAEAWNAIVVLKGAHTLIAEPSGRLAVLPFKTPALATAGTGDVLAGAITGLIAQGMEPFEAAVCAGYIHGLAGKMLEEQVGARGVTSADIVRYGLPQAFRALST